MSQILAVQSLLPVTKRLGSTVEKHAVFTCCPPSILEFYKQQENLGSAKTQIHFLLTAQAIRLRSDPEPGSSSMRACRGK